MRSLFPQGQSTRQSAHAFITENRNRECKNRKFNRKYKISRKVQKVLRHQIQNWNHQNESLQDYQKVFEHFQICEKLKSEKEHFCAPDLKDCCTQEQEKRHTTDFYTQRNISERHTQYNQSLPTPEQNLTKKDTTDLECTLRKRNKQYNNSLPILETQRRKDTQNLPNPEQNLIQQDTTDLECTQRKRDTILNRKLHTQETCLGEEPGKR